MAVGARWELSAGTALTSNKTRGKCWSIRTLDDPDWLGLWLTRLPENLTDDSDVQHLTMPNPDLYVVSGGNEEEKGNPYYKDRIYENDGNGRFTLLTNSLPDNMESGSIVINADYDGDGDQDLFVGSRLIPGQYPRPATSFILENVSNSSSINFLARNKRVFTRLSLISRTSLVSLTDFSSR